MPALGEILLKKADGANTKTVRTGRAIENANVTSPSPVGSVSLTFNIDGIEIKMNVSGLESVPKKLGGVWEAISPCGTGKSAHGDPPYAGPRA